MRTRTIYICDICGEEFCTSDEAEQHEAAHYGLTTEQFREWEELEKQVKYAAFVVSICNSESNQTAYDEADAELYSFIIQHGLENYKKPLR